MLGIIAGRVMVRVSAPQIEALGADAGPHRGLPAGDGATDSAADVAAHRLKHHLNRHPVPEWVDEQVYLHPYPRS